MYATHCCPFCFVYAAWHGGTAVVCDDVYHDDSGGGGGSGGDDGTLIICFPSLVGIKFVGCGAKDKRPATFLISCDVYMFI